MLWDIPEFLLKKHCPAVLLSHVNSAVLFPCRHGNGCESGGVQPSRLGTGALEEANMPPSSRRGLKKGKLVPRSLLIHICCNSNMLHLAHLSLEAVLGRQWRFIVKCVLFWVIQRDIWIYLLSVNNAAIHKVFPFVRK